MTSENDEGKVAMSLERWKKQQYAQAQVMEYYHRDLTYHMAELILVVINDLTVADQKFIDLLEERCQQSRNNKQIIVVHNFKEVSTPEELADVWKVLLPSLLSLALSRSVCLATHYLDSSMCTRTLTPRATRVTCTCPLYLYVPFVLFSFSKL